ncbi:glutamine type I family protein [Cryptosporidium andersoni]|uniref:Lengsin n=1 Tax=Cryptosporidium andersoni TaxID=117008 RepID=A0A1J4M9V6_9CRYT|nr:glutamine type I family protein [Cryptosporidium andersoni]
MDHEDYNTCKDYNELFQFIKLQNIEYLDCTFCDIFGSLHHITVSTKTIKDASDLSNGISFDSSSVRGMKYNKYSDMIIIPDPTTGWIDPFFYSKTLHLICNIHFSNGNNFHFCARSIAYNAQEVMKKSGIADICAIGAENEFFIFESAQYSTSTNYSFYNLDEDEAYWNSGTAGFLNGERKKSNLGGRRQLKQGYCAPYPADRNLDIRCEILHELECVGIPIEKHHHEVATCQHELGVYCSPLLKSADNVMSIRYLVKGIAHKHNKTVTFMPKPLINDNGSGMHINVSLWKNNSNLFFDKSSKYYNLSEIGHYFIGGILTHTPAIMAFTNPTTNSYKRLVAGYETPENLYYGAGDRDAAIRIPLNSYCNIKAQRIEFRVPDSSACPYLAFAAILCAGLEGIKLNIDPRKYLINDNQDNINMDNSLLKIPKTLSESLNYLEKDYDFLIKDGVFRKEFILNYIKLKREEVILIESVPNPKEFELYYDC